MQLEVLVVVIVISLCCLPGDWAKSVGNGNDRAEQCPSPGVNDTQVAWCKDEEGNVTGYCNDRDYWASGTILEIRCPNSWKPTPDSKNKKITTVCSSGVWLTDPRWYLNCQLDCGSPEGNNALDDEEGPWPWNVGLFTENRIGSGNFSYTCSGVLIAPEVVLSAAQCFTYTLHRQTVLLRPKDVRIYLGNFNSNDGRSTTNLEAVKQITLHPRYNPVNFDSDLAMIRLSKPVKLKSSVHPICLPRPDENDAETTSGRLVGFDSKGIAKGSLLSRVSSGRCENTSSIYSSLAKDTTFCYKIRKGEEVCSHIAGAGLATRNSSVLEGIRTGVPLTSCQEPIIFTRISSVRSWILDEIANWEVPHRKQTTTTTTTTTTTRRPVIQTDPPRNYNNNNNNNNYNNNRNPPPLISIPVYPGRPEEQNINALVINGNVQSSPNRNDNHNNYNNNNQAQTTRKPHRPEPQPPQPPRQQEPTYRPSGSNKPTPPHDEEDLKIISGFENSFYQPTTSRPRHPSSTRRPQATTDRYGNYPQGNLNPEPPGFGDTLTHRIRSRCPPIEVPEGVQLSCMHPRQDRADSCQDGGMTGTIATYRCHKHYVPAYGSDSIQRNCTENGEWRPAKEFGCRLNCGVSSRPKNAFIVNGVVADRVSWPWHATIFTRSSDDWVYRCGGALVSKRVIVTAAHCVTYLATTTKIEASSLVVVLAARSSDYTLNLNDHHSKIFNVEKTDVPDTYSPVTFDSDIALIVLEKDVTLSDYIKPVCWPSSGNSFHNNLEKLHLAHGSSGYTVGFGVDETGEIGTSLKETSLPFVTSLECRQALDRTPTASQFCAGYKNGINGTSVCNGDSGGGIYFTEKTQFSETFFLQGIVSNGDPYKRQVDEDKRYGGDLDKSAKYCNYNNYAVFSRVITFSRWIQKTLDEIEDRKRTGIF